MENNPQHLPLREASAFTNGLTNDQADEIDEVMISLVRIQHRIEALPSHRSLAVAITKLEEAAHWMRDRKHKPAGVRNS